MVAVLGISESSKADLLAELDRLGTNLLRVAPGQSFMGDESVLPESAAAMLRRVAGVEAVAAAASVSDQTVRRTPFIDEAETGGIAVVAADPQLRATIGATLRHGVFLNAATAATRPSSSAPRRPRPSASTDVDTRVWIGERWFTVIGILAPVTLAPQLDNAALIGFPAAASIFGTDAQPVDGLRPHRPGPRRRGPRAARPHGEPGAPGGGRRLAPVATRSRPARRPRPRSRRCSSGWARWRCWSAAWGSRT